MAGRKTIVWLIPENEERDSHTYHYSMYKTKNTLKEKFRFRKFNPVKQEYEWFKEVKAPSHSK